MPDWSTLILFLAAASVLVFTPGPNTLYIIARSVSQGRRAGIVSSLGVEVGTLIHVLAAAFGISALLLASATAFNIVKYAGAAYLIYLGIKILLTREKIDEPETKEEKNLSRTFSQTVLVNILNPKAAPYCAARRFKISLIIFNQAPELVNFIRPKYAAAISANPKAFDFNVFRVK